MNPVPEFTEVSVSVSAAMVCVLAATKPMFEVVVGPATMAPPPPPPAALVTVAEIRSPSLFTTPAVITPAIVPLHAAPDGQQATCPAKSALQTAFGAQQRFAAPRFEQELKWVGQVLEYCRRRSSPDAWSVRLARAGM
nr:hypothetical protein CFP56_37326 [Quercus suber]